MDDDVPEVQEHPAGVGVAFAVSGWVPLAAQIAVQRVEEGFHLAGVGGGGNDKIVREAGYLPDVK